MDATRGNVFRPAMRSYMQLYNRSRPSVRCMAVRKRPSSWIIAGRTAPLEAHLDAELSAGLNSLTRSRRRHRLQRQGGHAPFAHFVCVVGVKPMRLILRKDRGGGLRYYIH